MQLGKLDVSQSAQHDGYKTRDNRPEIDQGVTPETQNTQLAANPVALALYNDINACQNPSQLDAVGRLLWEKYGAGHLNDDEASYLQSCIERRRPVSQRTKTGKFAAIGKMNGRVTRFLPRQRPRSPDRQASRDRRRRLGGSSALPDTLRHYYTEGQRAVLCIVAGEVKHHGVCDLPIDKIAALAGVCRTTVQTTLHEARLLGHIKITERPMPGRKHLPNIVEIASPEWQTWIKRGSFAHRSIGSKSANLVSTTKNQVYYKKNKRSFQTLERGFAGGCLDEPSPRQTLLNVGRDTQAGNMDKRIALWRDQRG